MASAWHDGSMERGQPPTAVPGLGFAAGALATSGSGDDRSRRDETSSRPEQALEDEIDAAVADVERVLLGRRLEGAS